MSSFNKKTRSPGWVRNGHWVECQRTGMIVRVQDIRKEWTGLIVAKDEWEPRHPQDYLRGRKDDQSPVGPAHTESAGVDVSPVYNPSFPPTDIPPFTHDND